MNCRERTLLYQGLLRECATKFRTYESLHRAKGTESGRAKAEANAEIAGRIEAALSDSLPDQVDAENRRGDFWKERAEKVGKMYAQISDKCFELKRRLERVTAVPLRAGEHEPARFLGLGKQLINLSQIEFVEFCDVDHAEIWIRGRKVVLYDEAKVKKLRMALSDDVGAVEAKLGKGNQ